VWIAALVGPLVPHDLSLGLPLPYGPLVLNGAFVVISIYAIFYLLLEPVAAVWASPPPPQSLRARSLRDSKQILYFPFLYGLAYTATHFSGASASANAIALALFVASWILQVLASACVEWRQHGSPPKESKRSLSLCSSWGTDSLNVGLRPSWIALCRVHLLQKRLHLATQPFALHLSICPLCSVWPALLLAPLFVWLEVLFKLGYKPELHKRIVNNAARDILEFRKRQEAKKAK